MNGKTAKLIRRVAKARGTRKPRQIRALKRQWYALPWNERHEQRQKWEEEIS